MSKKSADSAAVLREAIEDEVEKWSADTRAAYPAGEVAQSFIRIMSAGTEPQTAPEDDPISRLGVAKPLPSAVEQLDQLRDLRRLVDVVWQHATESTAVPSTKTADKLISRAFSRTEQSQADTVAVPRVALEWLFGAAPDADGKWFGDCEEESRKHSRPYWWRTKFRSMIPALSRPKRGD